MARLAPLWSSFRHAASEGEVSASRRQGAGIVGRRDLGFGAVIGLIGFALGIPFALRTGFVYDDWQIVAHYTLELNTQVSFRPGFALWAPPQVALLGTHARAYYLVGEAIFGLSAGALYLCLRRLGLAALPAVAAALLYLVFPQADGVRFWWAASQDSLAVGLVLVGVLVGSGWVDKRDHGGLSLLVSLALLGVGTLVYEMAAALILMPLALLAWAPYRRRRFYKAGLDLLAVVPAGLWTLASNASIGFETVRPLGQDIARALTLWRAGFATFFVLPPATGATTDLVIGMATGTAVAVGLIVISRGRVRVDVDQVRIRRVALAIPGLLVCMLVAWLPLVPANDWYSPSLLGIGNRINLTSSVFFVTAVALVVAAASSWLTRVSRSFALATGLVVALLASLFWAWAGQGFADAQPFVEAAATRQAILRTVSRDLPAHPRHGSVVMLADYNTYRGHDWAPVFAATWDFDGAVKLVYRDPSLVGLPLLPPAACGPTALRLGSGVVAPYPHLYVVDVAAGSLLPVHDQASCAAVVSRHLARAYPG